ncbi:MAG: TPM domain-containing protein [Pseudomonadota bacterium]
MNLIKILLFSLLVFCSSNAYAVSFPTKPTAGSFITDEAHMISAEDKKTINLIAENLLKEQQIPLYVVTINSLLEYDSIDGIATYAIELFNNWGIGYKTHNYGILLLISKNERKVRIEFGASYDHRYDADALKIMSNFIIPEFKESNFSNGILNGAKALDTLARGFELPKQEVPKWFYPLLIIAILSIIGIAFSLFKSGRKGWGWAFLAGVGFLIWMLLRSSGNSGFGGGSGGGGGASGSW